ncbi:BBT_collapsed_G0031120.mRNA.1.CDS.1 [Saccharomyces cerevisiae]|nr:BBT_collapsed_G0031120.mRNA.1.CDS.1 [Saccharomyces cerevisiae]
MGNSSPLSETSMRRKHDKTIQERDHTIQNGLRHWNSIYNKVSTRVVNNLNSSYPDLWYYTLVHVYGPLFAFDEILSAQETSLVIIASLVPQDVNPQLRGHLKGALNIGCDKETVEAVRGLAILISQWCGVSWKSGVVKL